MSALIRKETAGFTGKSKKHRNLTIGVFTAQIDEPYQSTVWKGIESRAREVGIGVICFVGHRIDSPIISEATANFVYHMADDKNLDGLVDRALRY